MGHLFPVVEPHGGRRVSAPRIAAALQMHLRAADLPDRYTLLSLRVGGSLSKSLVGTAVDETRKIGGCK